MKVRIIGTILVIAVLSALYFVTGDDVSNTQPQTTVTQPQTKFNF